MFAPEQADRAPPCPAASEDSGRRPLEQARAAAGRGSRARTAATGHRAGAGRRYHQHEQRFDERVGPASGGEQAAGRRQGEPARGVAASPHAERRGSPRPPRQQAQGPGASSASTLSRYLRRREPGGSRSTRVRRPIDHGRVLDQRSRSSAGPRRGSGRRPASARATALPAPRRHLRHQAGRRPGRRRPLHPAPTATAPAKPGPPPAAPRPSSTIEPSCQRQISRQHDQESASGSGSKSSRGAGADRAAPSRCAVDDPYPSGNGSERKR